MKEFTDLIDYYIDLYEKTKTEQKISFLNKYITSICDKVCIKRNCMPIIGTSV